MGLSFAKSFSICSILFFYLQIYAGNCILKYFNDKRVQKTNSYLNLFKKLLSLAIFELNFILN